MNNIQNAGWFEDSTGRNLRRYWDGAQWTAHVQRHDGTSAVDPIAPAAPVASIVATPRYTPSLTAKIVFGGLVVATAASFLPWEQDTGPVGQQVTGTPADTGTLGVLVVLVAAKRGSPGRRSLARCRSSGVFCSQFSLDCSR